MAEPDTQHEQTPAEGEAHWCYDFWHPNHCTFTACSNISFKLLPFDGPHFLQLDKTFNVVLWGLFPLSDADELDHTIEVQGALYKSLYPLGPIDVNDSRFSIRAYDVHKLRHAIPSYERARVAFNVRLLQAVHEALLPHGWAGEGKCSPFEALQRRQAMGCLLTLDTCISIAKELAVSAQISMVVGKRMQDKRAIAAAVSRYCDAVLALWPWTATSLVFSPAEAFGWGLSPLEQEIWLGMAEACGALHDSALKDAPPKLRGSGPTPEWDFMTLARLCALVPIKSPYVSHEVLNKSFFAASKASSFFKSFLGSESVTLRLEMTPFFPPEMSKDSWAHATCDDFHYSCREGKWGTEMTEDLRATNAELRADADAAGVDLATHIARLELEAQEHACLGPEDGWSDEECECAVGDSDETETLAGGSDLEKSVSPPEPIDPESLKQNGQE